MEFPRRVFLCNQERSALSTANCHVRDATGNKLCLKITPGLRGVISCCVQLKCAQLSISAVTEGQVLGAAVFARKAQASGGLPPRRAVAGD